jgi:hypothetical protein
MDPSEPVKKSLVSGLGAENGECEVSERYRISGAACGRTLSSQGMEILKAELVQGSRNKHQAGVRGRKLKRSSYSFEW